MERKILHIDMDAFFAAVEQLDNPAYRGRAVIVGADPKGRGVVSTCSYEARKFGIHSAMPIQEAFHRCPNGIFLPVRGGRYTEVSRRIMQILEQYTPLVEPLSLDEAFLDLTGSERIFGSAVEIGHQIIARIDKEIGLSASIGIAPNKFLAKLASDLQKPKGFVVVTSENAADILENLPVRKLWGVGPKTEEQLLKLGIRTIGMLRQADPARLSKDLGDAGIDLYRLAHGLDERLVNPEEGVKSVGHEITFQVDTDDKSFLSGVLLWLCDQVARRLRRYQLKGRVITVKIRDCNFKTFTKRTSVTEVTDFEEKIYQEAFNLAQQIEWGTKKVRLIGVSVSGFHKTTTAQLNLFAEEAPVITKDLQKLHHAVDSLRDRYGEAIITKGTILHVKSKVGREDEADLT